MAAKSKIEWTDATWNPVAGCSVVSPGCKNCYAMKFAGTRLRHTNKYGDLTRDTNNGPVWNGKLAFDEKMLLQPLRWKKPKRIFVNSMSDLFHEDAPDEWIDKVFAVMALCPQHTFQILTKRSRRMREYILWQDDWRHPLPWGRVDEIRDAAYRLAATLKGQWDEEAGMRARQAVSAALIPARGFRNVWLGVSVEDQQRADERIPDLLATPAAVRFLSCEPLLGPVDLGNIPYPSPPEDPGYRGTVLHGHEVAGMVGQCVGWIPPLDWIIAGGESGPDARPMHPDWVRSLRDQCAAAGVPFFFKQWGEWHADALAYTCARTGECPPPAMKLGKKESGRLLDGREHNDFPATGEGACQ